jgi:hypothetical protein
MTTAQFVPGAYAGFARYTPLDLTSVPAALHRAIGHVVQVACAGIAPRSDPFAGQRLYLEWRSDDVFDGYLIPERDLEFVATNGERTERTDSVRGRLVISSRFFAAAQGNAEQLDG